MSVTEVHDIELDAATAALMVMAEHNVPPDIQELLVFGNPILGVPEGVMSKVIKAVLVTFRTYG